MPKTVSSSEAKSRFGAMVKWAVENQEDVIVRQYGDPTIVMVPFAAYEQILVWRERARREDAFEQFEAIRRRSTRGRAHDRCGRGLSASWHGGVGDS